MAINDYFHVTAAGAGDKSGDSWANAMDEAAFKAHLEGAVVAGDVHFVKDDTYTLDSSIDSSARSGTAVSPIVIIGVKSGTTNEGANVAYSDWSRDAADRPFFDCVTFKITTGDYYVLRNLSLEGSDTEVLEVGLVNIVENCKGYNDSGVANHDCLKTGTYGNVINCEIESESGDGIAAGSYSNVSFCYIHDCDNAGYAGIKISSNICDLAFNILDNCAIGISSSSRDVIQVLNHTFYGCGVDVNETNGYGWSCINNLHEGSTTDGYKWTTQTDINFFWKNHGNDARCNDMWDLVDTTTVFQDYEVSTGDPKFTTPGSDFSLQDSSPNIDNGMGISLGV